MRKVFQAIRFSSVGVFFAGIIGVIQGCSVEREGALFAVLLFLLNFCSGPVAEESTTTAVPIVIDDLANSSVPPTVFCTTEAFDTATITNIFQDIDRRSLRAGNNFVAGNSDITMTIVSNTLTVSASSGTGCDYADDNEAGELANWFDATDDNDTDFSTISAIAIPVTSASGVTDCFVTIATDSGGTLLTVGPLTPSPPSMVFSLNGAPALASANNVVLHGCNFAGSSSMTIGPPLAVP